MIKTIGKVGNSAAITLDKALLELLHLKIGDQVSLTVQGGRLIIASTQVGFSGEEIDAVAKDIFQRRRKVFRKLAE